MNEHQAAQALDRLAHASWNRLSPGEWLPWGPGHRSLDSMAQLVNLMGAAGEAVVEFARELAETDPDAARQLERAGHRIHQGARDIAEGRGARLDAASPMHVRALLGGTAIALRAVLAGDTANIGLGRATSA
jgi:hypothetical protein